jgi:hypothetical protein
MMSHAKLSFPVFSFRRIETPFDKRPGYRNYLAIVDVSKLPDLKSWRRINVRDPKLSGSLTRDIRDSFLTNKEMFVFLNRGLVLAVERAEFNNNTGILNLTLNDPNLHGLLDGGHTYEIIKRNFAQLQTDDGPPQYVKLEIIEGFDSTELVTLVDARNSSNQVRDESLMNLAKEFEKIKKVLANYDYADMIAYKEHETSDNEEPKPISIREVLSYLMTMDRRNFTAKVHPINAYRSKAACLKHFKEHKADFEPIYPLAGQILQLWDVIHRELPRWYNEVRGERGGVSGGRFGKLTGVIALPPESTAQPLDFLGGYAPFIIPAGLKYPILGALRALLVEKSDMYVWGKGIKPEKLLHEGLGKDLAQTIGEFALDAQNPSKTGKSMLVWQSCYQCAELAFLRHCRT